MARNFIISGFLALVATAQARRTILAYQGPDFDNLNCIGNFFACDNLPSNTCCSDSRFLLSSIRIENPTFDDGLFGWVPGGGGDGPCVQQVAFGRGSQCINDGAGGIVGISWQRVGQLRKKTAATEGECMKPNRFTFAADQTSLNLTAMSDQELDSLAALVKAGGSSKDLPSALMRRSYKL